MLYWKKINTKQKFCVYQKSTKKNIINELNINFGVFMIPFTNPVNIFSSRDK